MENCWYFLEVGSVFVLYLFRTFSVPLSYSHFWRVLLKRCSPNKIIQDKNIQGKVRKIVPKAKLKNSTKKYKRKVQQVRKCTNPFSLPLSRRTKVPKSADKVRIQFLRVWPDPSKFNKYVLTKYEAKKCPKWKYGNKINKSTSTSTRYSWIPTMNASTYWISST